ncbi:unknown [Haloarcula marismortui ATCC 43049]|uniref:Uncharacterized protein n=1 Tax=Haloarcula marismortui (strain ATCC 43049 / DSM 3752 / JCM 8966 / VKM B-1809) TaxID=272569 RepID=Q5V181_HALMA|nr:hypothetical protein [Haloarcula marismortui]AAV46722.1 unknown [Haloarcula marismortui ATCC 43049]
MTREKNIRVSESELSTLKAARDSEDETLPLGYVAAEGAKQLLAEDSEIGF